MMLRRLGLLLVIALSTTLVGCTPSPPAPDDAVASQLEQTVLAVTVAVAEEDWEKAAADLEVLEGQVDTALENGGISVERAAEIRSAIALVLVDIAAGIAEQAPDVDPTETPEPDKPGNGNGNGNGNKKP